MKYKFELAVTRNYILFVKFIIVFGDCVSEETKRKAKNVNA